jgi:hypothetical protein
MGSDDIGSAAGRGSGDISANIFLQSSCCAAMSIAARLSADTSDTVSIAGDFSRLGSIPH